MGQQYGNQKFKKYTSDSLVIDKSNILLWCKAADHCANQNKLLGGETAYCIKIGVPLKKW